MSLRHALLGALADQPRSGYALLKHFEQSLAYAWPASHSQIYPELARLLEDGLIEESETGARRSRTYAITRSGLRRDPPLAPRHGARPSRPERCGAADVLPLGARARRGGGPPGGRASLLARRPRRVRADTRRADRDESEGAHVPHRAGGRHPVRSLRGSSGSSGRSPRFARPRGALPTSTERPVGPAR